MSFINPSVDIKSGLNLRLSCGDVAVFFLCKLSFKRCEIYWKQESKVKAKGLSGNMGITSKNICYSSAIHKTTTFDFYINYTSNNMAYPYSWIFWGGR
ncbi:hypothetical protein GCM10010913_45910 [Paenibacillus aceti]|uniref:Uncharacterized protein n=1 Tax=Paenibacillus aceti TaxID=1820010 RepID=A0ABQ1W9C5_9BACL|nr:hypothetical protein GCM10010913_45910 [Paenibacillus aceti]